MNETSAVPATRADTKKSTKVRSLNFRRELVLSWTMLAALTLILAIARTPAYSAALLSATPSKEETIELIAYMFMVLGFILSTMMLAKSVMTYHEQLIKGSRSITD